jgi:hypothetical protein
MAPDRQDRPGLVTARPATTPGRIAQYRIQQRPDSSGGHAQVRWGRRYPDPHGAGAAACPMSRRDDGYGERLQMQRNLRPGPIGPVRGGDDGAGHRGRRARSSHVDLGHQRLHQRREVGARSPATGPARDGSRRRRSARSAGCVHCRWDPLLLGDGGADPVDDPARAARRPPPPFDPLTPQRSRAGNAVCADAPDSGRTTAGGRRGRP